MIDDDCLAVEEVLLKGGPGRGLALQPLARLPAHRLQAAVLHLPHHPDCDSELRLVTNSRSASGDQKKHEFEMKQKIQTRSQASTKQNKLHGQLRSKDDEREGYFFCQSVSYTKMSVK